MAEVRAAIGAMNLGTGIAKLVIRGGADRVFIGGLVKTRPAGFTIVFCIGTEQVVAATGAIELAVAFDAV